MRANLLSVTVILGMLGSMAWGSPAQVFNPEEGSFLGFILDSASSALPGAKISAVNITTSARHDARMLPTGLFGIAHLPKGIYRVNAELPGFQTIIRVEPIEKGPSRVNFWLPVAPARDGASGDLGVITGTVRGYDNVSLPGVRITVKNGAAGKTQQVSTDARGNFSVSDLPAGVLEIVAERDGFQPLHFGDVHLTGKFMAQLHLKLQVLPARAGAAVSAR